MRSRVVALVVVSVLGVACSRAAAGRSPSSPDDLSSLVSDLRSHGATVKVGEAASQPFFTASGRIVLVNDNEIQVFRFPTRAAAASAATAVAPDGYSIGTSMIEWVDVPHLYRWGSLIVLYVGKDQPTLALLREVVGPQFAGGGQG